MTALTIAALILLSISALIKTFFWTGNFFWTQRPWRREDYVLALVMLVFTVPELLGIVALVCQ